MESRNIDVCIAIHLEAKDASVAIINKYCSVLKKSSKISNGEPRNATSHSIGLTSKAVEPIARCIFGIQQALDFCSKTNYRPVAIGVSTKGNVENGVLISGGKHINIKQILEEKFQLPTQVLNRFHAFAFGISNDMDYGAINVSNGVGYGVVKNGNVLEQYDPINGAGGMRIIKRSSDGKSSTIASIAGVSGIKSRAIKYCDKKCTLGDIFGVANSNNNLKIILDDAAHAIIELIIDLNKKFHPKHIIIMLYNQSQIAQHDKINFMKYIENGLKQIPVRLVEDDISETETKLIGVAKRAFQFSSISKLSHISGMSHISNSSFRKNIFAITGEPTAGKSTFLRNICDKLIQSGIKVGGIITTEIRNDQHQRIGFSINILSKTDNPIELAITKDNRKIDFNTYTVFHNYLVNIKNIKQFIVPALDEAMKNSDVLIIDEVGNMQLFSKDFEQIIEKILEYDVPTIVTVPMFGKHKIVQYIKDNTLKYGNLFTLSKNNRSESQKKAEQILLPNISKYFK